MLFNGQKIWIYFIDKHDCCTHIRGKHLNKRFRNYNKPIVLTYKFKTNFYSLYLLNKFLQNICITS